MDFDISLYQLILLILAAIVGITCHEAAHARAAFWLGQKDYLTKQQTSFLPHLHLDLMGFITALITFPLHIGLAWGKTVFYQPLNLKYRFFDTLMITLSGPFANLLIALICTFLYQALSFLSIPILEDFLMMNIQFNIGLAVYHLLIPLPPFDLSRLVVLLFSNTASEERQTFLTYGPIISFILIFLFQLFPLPIISTFFASIKDILYILLGIS